MTSDFENPTPNEAEALNQAKTSEIERILNTEQKSFPSRIEIKGGIAVHPIAHKDIPYRAGVVELKPDGTIVTSGFGREHSTEFGQPKDVLANYVGRDNKQQEELIPREASWRYICDPKLLSRFSPENIADVVNLEFCIPSSWGLPISLLEELPPGFSEELKDKALIGATSTIFVNYFADEGDKERFRGLIQERPDLATEIFKYLFRSFSIQLGHCNGWQIADYFFENPDMVKLVPESHQYYLAAIFLHACMKDLIIAARKKTISAIDEVITKITTGSSKFGFSDPAILDKVNELISRAESLKSGLEK